jgi:predicted nucleic-acid-binding protein
VRAIDTNVIVRHLTGDDATQAEAARRVLKSGGVFVATTVFLESEWVLRSAYGFEGSEIIGRLRGVAGIPGLTVEDPLLLARAFEWAEGGMDFADALHLSASEGCSEFVTFDARLAKLARGRASTPVAIPK